MEGLRVEIGLKEPSRGSCRDDPTGTIRQGRIRQIIEYRSNERQMLDSGVSECE